MARRWQMALCSFASHFPLLFAALQQNIHIAAHGSPLETHTFFAMHNAQLSLLYTCCYARNAHIRCNAQRHLRCHAQSIGVGP